MTRQEFIDSSVTFEPGGIIVLSGPDYDAINSLMMDCQAKIESETDKLCLVFNSRATTTYAGRLFEFTGAVTESVVWEYISLIT